MMIGDGVSSEQIPSSDNPDPTASATSMMARARGGGSWRCSGCERRGGIGGSCRRRPARDRLDRVLDAMRVARRSRRIALQSVYAGIGLSLAGMVVAALGYLTPVQGALSQEAIDVAVILNALRALHSHD